MANVDVEVLVLADADKHNQTQIIVESFSLSERIKAGFKKGSLFWGATFFSVFVPIAHFVLVPLFLISGFVAFYIHFGHSQVLRAGTIKCPSCKKDFEIDQRSFTWPMRYECPDCKLLLLIRPQ
jgi:hypothetical protein